MEFAARLKPGETLGDRILKVNHAGEHGAVKFYRGQLVFATWRAPALVSELRDFQAHEERHRSLFWAELMLRGRPRCRSYHLCGIGGFFLGAATGLFGASAIAATTVAVERVVLRHLEAQIKELRDVDPRAVDAINAIIEDERTHHDQAKLETQQGSMWPRVLMPIVSRATEAVIWAGMRL